ncbi:hypothetical protein D2E78_05150 [Mycobacteroides abscessus]|nr:hypothetical protein DDJ98_22315 [Mycobacteroides abscessus]RIS26224.1 hypothetical protein D2E67_16185 [Mycobacteroides abscessus]RIT18877.1 hypothetical protein D2E78_05150 [Mycobacteroides abscessus]
MTVTAELLSQILDCTIVSASTMTAMTDTHQPIDHYRRSNDARFLREAPRAALWEASSSRRLQAAA